MDNSAAALEDQPALRQAHDALLKQSDIQFNFPTFTLPKPPAWLEALAKFLSDNWTPIKWGFWIVAGVLLITIAVVLLRQYWPLLANWRPTPRAAPEPEAAWRPTVQQARALLSDADALAQRGQYDEAVHLILLRSIEDIQERRPTLVRPTLTSREIGRLAGVPEAARGAFAGIARMVERALFAGHPIGAAEFAGARAEYEAFAFAPAWQSTPPPRAAAPMRGPISEGIR